MKELLSSLHAALKHAKEGYTVAELCASANLPETDTNRLRMRVFLKGEIAAGRVIGKRGRRAAIDGTMRPVPIYIPVTTKRK